jgi:hypothetical protein
MLVNIVQGWLRKAAGVSPRRKIRSRDMLVAIKKIRFRIIRNNTGLSLKPGELWYLIL